MPSRNDMDTTSVGTSTGGNRTLTDICTDAFSLIFYIHAGNDPGHPDDLHKNIAHMLRDVDKNGKRQGYADEDLKAARYALCALIDETILNSRWGFKDQWAERPLQLEHFGEHMAGERFFDLLERVRHKGRARVDLLEVFCITLILGFRGKYKLQPDELVHLTRELVGEITKHRGGGPSALSPHWKIPDEVVEKPVKTIPRWILVTGAASIAFVIVLFIILRVWLGSAADAFEQLGL